MSTFATLLFCALIRFQEPARQPQIQGDLGAEVRKNLEKLGSDSVQDREAGAQAIRTLGEAALEELRKHRGHPDPEVRARVLGLVTELEWKPDLPPGLCARDPIALHVLLCGKQDAQIAKLNEIAGNRSLSPALGARIALEHPDPALRGLVAHFVSQYPRPRYKKAYLRLLEDWAFVALPQALRDKGTPFPRESLLGALEAVVDPSDADRLTGLLKNPDKEISGAAEVLLERAGRAPTRERLQALVETCSFPVCVAAAEQLARRFGPEPFRDLKARHEPSTENRIDEARLRGLLTNGSAESIQAVERFARGGARGSLSVATCPLVAAVGTEPAAQGLLDFLHYPDLGSWYARAAADSLLKMPSGIVVKAIHARKSVAPEVLRRLYRPVLESGDEDLVLQLFQVDGIDGLEREKILGESVVDRPEVTRACKAIYGKEKIEWAQAYAHHHLCAVDPPGRAALLLEALKDGSHPGFPSALADLDSLPQETLKTLLPELANLLLEQKSKLTRAYCRSLRREWVDPLKRIARNTTGPGYVAAYYLLDSDVPTPQEKIEIARGARLGVLWRLVRGSIPAEAYDAVRDEALNADPDPSVAMALALASSGDARPFEWMKKAPKYISGVAAVRALTEGDASAPDLIRSYDRREGDLSIKWEDILLGLGSLATPEVESFLLRIVEAGPFASTAEVTEEDRRDRQADRAEAQAIRSLSQLRSERFRNGALRMLRHYEAGGPPTKSWEALIEALGVLRVEGAIKEIVSWLEDARRRSKRTTIDSAYLDALGALGDESHTALARSFLDDAGTRIAAARALDRLFHRKDYARLEGIHAFKMPPLRDPAWLSRTLAQTWGLETRISGEVPFAPTRFGLSPAIARVDGFQVLQMLSARLDRAPLWKDGRVGFMDGDSAARYWAAKR